MARKKRRQKRRGKCWFCQSESLPTYREYETLKKFTTQRGKIVSGAKSGVCAKHQRQLSKAIKRARFLALLPYTAQV